MALGATRGDVGRTLVKRGFVIALGGTITGIAAARATGTLLSGLLFEVKATDLPTLAGVVGLVLTVAILASLIPARIGARVEPVTALRVDD